MPDDDTVKFGGHCFALFPTSEARVGSLGISTPEPRQSLVSNAKKTASALDAVFLLTLLAMSS